MYLGSTITQSESDVWLIDLGAYFHMIVDREWFCEYEKYKGGYSFLRDDSKPKS